jgi:cell division transport system permease protein
MFDTALKNIRRSPYQAFAAISMTGLTVYVVSLFTLVSFGSHIILRSFESKPQIIAYLRDDHKTGDVELLVKSLTGSGLVKSTNYVSKQQALELYKKSVGNDPLLLGSITDLGLITADILPASLEVTAKTPDNFPKLVKILQESNLISITSKGTKEIDFPEDVVTELTAWTNAIRVSGLILISLLCFNSVISIVSFVSMKIASRRTEIGTMKLLGAKGWFIVKPFLIESFLYGLCGAFVGWLGAFITILYATPFLAARLTGIIIFPLGWAVHLILFTGLIITFSVLGLISGFLASVRFLRR